MTELFLIGAVMAVMIVLFSIAIPILLPENPFPGDDCSSTVSAS